jgi:hypothetical protein
MAISDRIAKALAKPPVEECRTCLYFYFKESPSEAMGSCHRYPQDLQRPAAFWCGEYKRDPDEANYVKG